MTEMIIGQLIAVLIGGGAACALYALWTDAAKKRKERKRKRDFEKKLKGNRR